MNHQTNRATEDALLRRYKRGLRTATRNNTSAYAYSVFVTAAMAVMSGPGRSPQLWQIVLFAAGAVAGFLIVEAFASRFFRVRIRGETSDVVMFGTAMSALSIAAALAAVYAADRLLTGWTAWLFAPLSGTMVFLATVGVEMMLGRLAAEKRAEQDEQDLD